MNELEKNSVQFDYFSRNYAKFEEDFYKFANINIPLTFLADDLLQHMVSTHHEYFRLNAKNSKDFKDHYFVFRKIESKENKNICQFEYLGHLSAIEFFKFSSRVSKDRNLDENQKK